MSEPQQPPIPSPGPSPTAHDQPQQPRPHPQQPQPHPQQPLAMPQGYPPQHQTPPPYAQPQYAQQPSPSYPQQPTSPSAQWASSAQWGYGQPAAAPAARTAAGLGRVALILALVGLALNLISMIAYPVLYRLVGFGGSGALSTINGGLGFVQFALAVAALIVGLVAARREGPKVLAGIAIGVGAAQTATALLGAFSGVVYSAF